MFGINIQTNGGNEAIFEPLDRIREKLVDLHNLSQIIASVLLNQNREARSSGLDKDGVPFDNILESTVKRRARRGDGDGPPLSPNQSTSKIQNPDIQTFRVSEGRHKVVMTWPEMPFLHFHVTGVAGRMVARDPVGITPEGWQQIRDAVATYCADLTKN